jgi:C1A family cysteine protease
MAGILTPPQSLSFRDESLMILTNAIPPFDGDPIAIPNPACIKDFSLDHSVANADCTRVELDNGAVFHVQESVEEICAMISADKIGEHKMTLPLSPNNRRYGALKSKPDARDYGVARLSLPKTIPSAIDLTEWCGPVRDQGDLGACTAFAGTAMTEFLWRRYKNRKPNFSPLYLYYQERALDGDRSKGDTGSTGRTCVKALNQFGVCLEATDPYNPSAFQHSPTVAESQEAILYRSGAYHAITNVQDMKACLASGYGFIAGFNVYDSFESAALAKTGLMPVPDRGRESLLGGHEVFFCGYDDSVECPGASVGAFKAQNSWGTAWARSGFFWFPYQCAADPSVLMDAFIQHLGKPW